MTKGVTLTYSEVWLLTRRQARTMRWARRLLSMSNVQDVKS